MLRSDADGNYEIDEDELFDWIQSYPELKHIFGLSTTQGYLARYDTYNRGMLMKREIDHLAKDMDDKMSEVEFFVEERSKMKLLQQQLRKANEEQTT